MRDRKHHQCENEKLSETYFFNKKKYISVSSLRITFMSGSLFPLKRKRFRAFSWNLLDARIGAIVYADKRYTEG